MKKKNYTKIIAEIALSHNGNYDYAKKLIQKCKDAGANYVKFQTHIAENESSLDEKFRNGFNFKEKNRFEYWKKRQFTPRQWKALYRYAIKIKIGFLSSPFSVEAIKILRSIGLKKWKISSGEFFSKSLLDEILKKKDAIILSTGMATIPEIAKKIKLIKKNKNNLTLLQCTSKYPVKLEEVGLNIAKYYKKKFKVKNGISDHSGTIYPALEAIRQNFDFVEVHVEDKKKIGPDTPSAITFSELSIITNYASSLQKLNVKIDKNKSVKSLKKTKILFTKSICSKRDISKNEFLTMKNICFKKPGSGIPENKINEVLNYRFKNNIDKNKIITWSDIKK